MGSITGTPTHEITSKRMVSAENAEDPRKFLERVHSFLNEWGKHPEDILMVCHAGVGRVIETIKIDGDPELFYDLPPYPNASVIKLDWVK